MRNTCRPNPASPRPTEIESRAEYLDRIAHCAHPGPRRPGWPCGGCGREWSEIDAINEIEEEKEGVA